MKPTTEFYAKQLRPVIGQTLIAIADGGEWWGLIFADAKGNETVMWILQDDEGNGPGSFALEGAHVAGVTDPLAYAP